MLRKLLYFNQLRLRTSGGVWSRLLDSVILTGFLEISKQTGSAGEKAEWAAFEPKS